MEYKKLGKTGIEVSRLCFGSLTLSKSQENLSLKESGELLSFAHNQGINFIDTAELYENYANIREVFKYVPRENLVITSKTYAYDKKGAQDSLKKYLDELGTDYADIFLLHEQEDEFTLKGHYEALKELYRLKKEGYIKAVGISTHKVKAVRAALEYPEIEVIHPMINIEGLGILDGTRDDMLDAIGKVRENGVGIYAMKVLGGGHLISRAEDAIKWAVENPLFDSVALGMQSREEVINNSRLISHEEVPEEIKESLRKSNRQISVEEYCIGCGRCAAKCQAKAIKIIDNKAVIDRSKCILCGYCANVCPDFYIKVH